jgi:hypothetical protein
MSKYFRASHYTIKEFLSRQFGLRKFARRKVPDRLSDDENATRAWHLKALLAILLRLQDNSFEGISTGDESLFLYEH